MGNSRIQFRRGRELGWLQENPILFSGEPGYETDTKRFKIGDGKTPWNDLPYSTLSHAEIEASLSALVEHINDETPHPAYDDGPSFDLLYQNAKV